MDVSPIFVSFFFRVIFHCTMIMKENGKLFWTFCNFCCRNTTKNAGNFETKLIYLDLFLGDFLLFTLVNHRQNTIWDHIFGTFSKHHASKSKFRLCLQSFLFWIFTPKKKNHHAILAYSCKITMQMMRRVLAERLARWIRAYDLQDCQMRRTHVSLAVKVIPGKTLLLEPCSEETIADELAETGLPFTCTFAKTLCLTILVWPCGHTFWFVQRLEWGSNNSFCKEVNWELAPNTSRIPDEGALVPLCRLARPGMDEGSALCDPTPVSP